MALKYKGKDPSTDWLPGVPARNLSDDDIKAMKLDARALAKTALYEEAEPPKPRAKRATRTPRRRREPVVSIPEPMASEFEAMPESSFAAEEERE